MMRTASQQHAFDLSRGDDLLDAESASTVTESAAFAALFNAEQRASLAVRQDDLETVARLLDDRQLGAECCHQLLFLCCELDRKGILRLLIKSLPSGVNVNQARDEDQLSCLMIAAKKNSHESVSVLLSAPAPNNTKVNATDQYDWTSLMYACYYGSTECARLLLDAGAFVNVFDSDHLSCLIWASGRGHVEIVRLLLRFGAKVDATDKYGTTPLIWACRKGHNQVVELLLQAGANINATGMFGWSALLTTVRGNYIETTKLLLRHEGLNVNTCDAQRLSPLMIACKDGLADIVRLLLTRDAFVNLSDRYGHTALIHATKSGHCDIVSELIKSKADVDHTGFDKKSALFWAVEKGYLEVCRVLLKAGPNLEITTNDGETCLIRAVKSKRYDIMRLLLCHNAKVSATDKYGDTVLHTAVRMQSRSLVELLLSNPKNCQLIYKPNKRKETPFSLDQNNPKPIFPSLLDEFEQQQQQQQQQDNSLRKVDSQNSLYSRQSAVKVPGRVGSIATSENGFKDGHDDRRRRITSAGVELSREQAMNSIRPTQLVDVTLTSNSCDHSINATTKE